MEYEEVPDFDALGRYMRATSPRAGHLRAWAQLVQKLDIEVIAPQHGAFCRGKAMVKRFVDGCAGLECGVDLIQAP